MLYSRSKGEPASLIVRSLGDRITKEDELIVGLK